MGLLNWIRKIVLCKCICFTFKDIKYVSFTEKWDYKHLLQSAFFVQSCIIYL